MNIGMKKAAAIFVLAGLILSAICTGALSESGERIHPTAVIMSMFEVDALAGDDPGEAQYYYEEYFPNPEVYEITKDPFGCSLYVQDDLALCLLGQGKSSAAVNVAALLCDPRFDFSDTTFLVTGCAGSSEGYGVVGDVYIITATVDYDLGHTADVRDLADASSPIWYRMEEYDPVACHLLNPELTDAAYTLTKDLELKTTDDARSCMARNFDNADWAMREPRVLKGTSITSDDYWKGEYKHQKAMYMTEAYQTPDPYTATVMEDNAIALAFEKMGMLDQLLIIRSSVNMDVFLDGETPESFWGGGKRLLDNGFDGFTDIFPVSMENCYKVGRTILERIREGGL